MFNLLRYFEVGLMLVYLKQVYLKLKFCVTVPIPYCNCKMKSLFGYPLGDNHIRIGNRTRLYAVSVLDCHRQYYFPVPLFPGISISLGTKLQEFSTALLRHNL